jgi:hypothetical protein
MAKSKKKRSRKAPSGGGSTSRRKPAKRRRKSLSSGGSMHTLMVNSFKHTAAAASGGLAAVYANKWMPANWGKPARIGAILLAGLAGSYFGFPVMSGGMVGGMTALTFPTGLNEDEASFADDDSLSDQPLFLDEDGAPMVLEEGEDGSAGYRYLSDDEIQMLEREGAFAEYEEV